MFNISPFQWAKSLRYRSEFLGWFVSSILSVLLVHIVLVIGLLLIGLDLIPQYIGLFLVVLSLISISKFVYFLVRMLAPAESPKAALNSSRNIAVKGLIGGVFLVQTAGVASRYLLNISPAALHPFAPLFAILLYSTAIAVGYDGARSKNVLDRVDALSNEEINGSPLFEIFSGKSKRKALSAVFGCLIIGLIVGLSTSPITGMSTAGSIATLLALGIQLYPDES